MADVSVSLVRQADDVHRFRSDNDSDAAFFAQHKFAERIRAYLLDQYNVPLTKTTEANLSVLIADRLSGINNEADFRQGLMEAVTKSGLGLREKQADDMSRYMEKLIAIGVDVSYKN